MPVELEQDEALRVAAKVNAELAEGARPSLQLRPMNVEVLISQWLDQHEHIRRSSLATVRRYRTAAASEKAPTRDSERAMPDQRTTGSDRSGTEEVPMTTNAHNDLLQMINELQPRVRELESVMMGCAEPSESGFAGGAGQPEDTESIIATIKNLQKDIDAAHGRGKTLEAEFAVANSRLAEEQKVRAGMEDRIKVLLAKANLSERLQDECALLDEEQSVTAHRLQEAIKALDESRTRPVGLGGLMHTRRLAGGRTPPASGA